MRKTILLALLLLSIAPLTAGTRRLSIDDIYDREKRIAFGGQPQTGFVWLDDTHYFYPHRDAKGEVDSELIVDAPNGREVALFDPAVLQRELAAVQGVSADDAKKLSRPAGVVLNSARNALLLTLQNDVYLFDLPTRRLRRITSTPDAPEEEVSFSPDGARIAFVRANDLYVATVATGTEQRLTNDGSDDVRNGKLDWVYQEEIWGRYIFRGYWWSPDSRSLAFLRLDEKKVPRFAIVDHLPVHQSVEMQAYPKAGDPNPDVSLHVVDVASGARTRLAGDPSGNGLIVDVAWQPDGKRVVYQLQNREQTWLDLIAVDRASAQATRLLRETTKAWVEPSGSPQWLSDGSFLWLSERTGFKHLYRISRDGSRQTQLTHGDWEVRTLHGADAKNNWIYFSATAQSVLGLDLYRCRADGSSMQRLVARDGTHTASFNPSLTLFIDSWSDINTPPQTRLHRAGGELVRMIDENRVAALDEFALVRPEFRQVKTRDGFVMEALLLRPLDFDPTKKYPVYEHTYSGPHAQQVLNKWGGPTYLWHQFLAQNGIAVWICDNRTASGKGAVSTWPAYREFGPTELRDLVDGLAALKREPWIDGSRVLLNGWSFGGFMTTYALTHSDVYKAGIAGGSVTDWRDYDSVYTERYMLTPEHNPDGYARSAPLNAAKNLRGDLLLLHGTTDDNVHLQNTLQFAYELQKAGKLFDLMLYPRSQHGVTDPALAKQLRSTMWKFVQRELMQR